MANVSLIVSFPGAHHRVPGSANLLVGNPQARVDVNMADIPSAPSWSGTPELVVATDTKTRLLVVQTFIPLEMVMTFTGEDPAGLVATLIEVPDGGVCAYSTLLPSGATGVYLRNPA
jgi:hypothetical protein